jgi:hypothetical protein
MNDSIKKWAENLSNKMKEINTGNDEEFKESSIEVSLGIYVGQYIIDYYLPTISTDMLLSRKVIEVSEEEKIEYERLHKNWWDKYHDKRCSKKNEAEEEWKEYQDYIKLLHKKYLPETLVCYVPRFDINVEKIDDIKEAIRGSLWNCDLCNYSLERKDILIEQDDVSIFTKITLKRD